jgi:hypothetical protein
VNSAEFRLLSGESAISSYQSSPGVRRTFCSVCGATLQFVRGARPDGFWLAVGTLDDDPSARPSHHIFVGSKAPWFEITDDLPQYEQRRSDG